MFRKKLSDKEINQVLEKIKKKYEEYAALHGELIFSYNGFKQRYQNQLYSKGNLDIFLYAEIQALEDRKKEIDEKINKRQRVLEAQEILNKKENELLKKIEKYPVHQFHPEARLEIKKLAAIIKTIFPQIQKHTYDIPSKQKDLFNKAQNSFKDFMIAPYSGTFAQYVRELNQISRNPAILDGLEQSLIREWGVSLNTIYSLLKNLPTDNEEIKDFCSILKQITEDFRLVIFKPLI